MMNKPVLVYYKSKQLEYEQWYFKGFRHRTNGPAYINYYESGQIKYSRWYAYDIPHRTDGPAEAWYNKAGQIKCKNWFINGILIDQLPQWLKDNNISAPYTLEDQTAIILRWS